MSCIAVPTPPLPPLPPGVSFPIWNPPSPPALKVCCNIPLPIPPLPAPILAAAFPPAVVSAYQVIQKGVQTFFDLLSFDCPLN